MYRLLGLQLQYLWFGLQLQYIMQSRKFIVLLPWHQISNSDLFIFQLSLAHPHQSMLHWGLLPTSAAVLVQGQLPGMLMGPHCRS